jgi:hypothetical protein
MKAKKPEFGGFNGFYCPSFQDSANTFLAELIMLTFRKDITNICEIFQLE